MDTALPHLPVDRAGPRGETPLVLLHAGVADRRMWDATWPALTARRDVVRLDLPGFGEASDRPTVLDPTRAVLATLDHLDLDRCHLVGASFGAGVAVEVALTDPDRVVSLLLCPPGGALLAEMTPDLQAFVTAERSALEEGDLDAAVEANVDTWLVGPGRGTADVDPSLVTAVRTMQRRAFEIADSWGDVEEVELDPPALDRLSELSCPVLLLVGGHDLLTTYDAVRRLVDGVPGIRRVDWPDVAHLPSLERPGEFAELLLDWTAAPVPDYPVLMHTALDATDVRGLAEFYRRLLGLVYRPGDEPPADGGADEEDWLVLLDGRGARVLAFQEVPVLARTTWPTHEVPQQMHLDFRVPDLAELTRHRARAVELGATVILDRTDEEGEPLVVLADPEGHPFCLLVGGS